MSSSSFAFPPPPPPPPRRAAPSNANNLQSGYAKTGGGRSGRGDWHGRAARGGYTPRGDRGRGRGHTLTDGGHGSYHSGHSDFRTQGDQSNYNPSCEQGNFQSTSSSHPPRSELQIPNGSYKRSHDAAFTTKSVAPRRSLAAPAVPSFNASISNLLPNISTAPIADVVKAPERPRRSNQLGLTPALDGAGSDSDDDNEEGKLKKDLGNSIYEFEYRGQTSALKSASDIAVWIAERRKKYPTQAKATAAKKEEEEKRKFLDEKRKAEREAAKVRNDKQRKEREDKVLLQKLLEVPKTDTDEVISQPALSNIDYAEAKSIVKAEKLRRKAAKTQIQLAKAERAIREAQGKRRNSTEQPKKKENGGLDIDKMGVDDSTISVAESGLRKPPGAVEQESVLSNGTIGTGSDVAALSDSSNLSDSDDTSSSGSSSKCDSSGVSDSESESDSKPEMSTSKAHGPMKVPPPNRVKPSGPKEKVISGPKEKALCKNFLRTGKCRFQHRCHYSHVLPGENVAKGSKQVGPRGRTERKSLFQAMVEKEQEQEREQMLRATVTLGRQGALDGEPGASQ